MDPYQSDLPSKGMEEKRKKSSWGSSIKGRFRKPGQRQSRFRTKRPKTLKVVKQVDFSSRYANQLLEEEHAMIALLKQDFETKDDNDETTKDNQTPDLKLAVAKLNKATKRLSRTLASLDRLRSLNNLQTHKLFTIIS